MTTAIQFPRVPFARRMADPVHKHVERHWWTIQAKDLPDGLGHNPNPRQPSPDRIERGVYNTVRDNAIGVEGGQGLFHLKNRGIRVVADDVRKISDDEFEVVLREPIGNGGYEGDGIFDGSSTTEILRTARAELDPETWVDVFIYVGLEPDAVTEVAQGHNTGMQVQDRSILYKQHKFDLIEKALNGTYAADAISYFEGDNGEVNVEEVIALMTMFNVHLFPNTDDQMPTIAYYSRARNLGYYQDQMSTYRDVAALLPTILELHDIILVEAKDLYPGQYGSARFVGGGKKDIVLPFTGKTLKLRMMKGALYPILGAFRAKVEVKGSKLIWTGGFAKVVDVWRSVGADMLRETKTQAAALKENVNALGKDRQHWKLQYQTAKLTP